ncbi:MAG: hypothetical protein ACTHZ9_05665 [Leucobacter sp.]
MEAIPKFAGGGWSGMQRPAQAFDFGTEGQEELHEHARDTVDSENQQLKVSGDDDSQMHTFYDAVMRSVSISVEWPRVWQIAANDLSTLICKTRGNTRAGFSIVTASSARHKTTVKQILRHRSSYCYRSIATVLRRKR